MQKVFLIICFLSLSNLLFTQTEREWFSKGEEAFDRGEYYEATIAFENYLELTGKPEKAFLPLGIAYYETAQLPLSEKYLSYLINKDPDPRAVLYYAKVLHAQNKFAEAANYYKKYLSVGEKSAHVKKQILHCRSGLKMKGEMAKAFVDNLGPSVNTRYDELGPVLSPNHPDRLYFSSASEKSEGGKRDPNGFPNDEFGAFTFDMFKIERKNGVWDQAYPLNPRLNTPRNEVLYGFTNDGLVAFFFRGFNMKFGDIVTDTFQTNEMGISDNPVFNSPADASFGDKDLFFINDTTFIFSSVRLEGQGGYDLYICMQKGGVWKDPVSLGPAINSPYHERTPHITQNGGYLYFSSDRPQSIGGFDVYSAKWKAKGWSEVNNLGKGVNSSSDDLYFTTGSDDYSAYLSSDRKTGYGGFDLYTAYFKEPTFKTQRSAMPDFSIFFSEERVSLNEKNKPGAKKENWELKPLIFDKGQEAFEPAQEIILDEVAENMKLYPKLHLNLFSFSAYDGPKKYDLYFGLKRAENVAQQLIRRGVSEERILITACGSAYPLVLNSGADDKNQTEQLNRRIDFKFFTDTELPFNLEYDVLVPDHVYQNSPYKKFYDIIEGLSYSVQIAATQQLYEGNALEEYRNPLIRSKAGNATIKYTIGIFNNYNEARNLRYRLIKDGYKGSFVTAYIGGIRKTRDQLRSFLNEYDDLRAYINVE